MVSGHATVRDPGFSIAALVGFFARSLAMQDVALLPSEFRLVDLRDTRISIALEKRRLADYALKVGGPGPLLSVGQRLGEVCEHPNIAVLLGAISTDLLAWRWMRIEQAHQTPHYIDIQCNEKFAWCCMHESRDATPSRAESLLVIGILAGLLELIGVKGVAITVGDERIHSDALIADPTLYEHVSVRRFRITWSNIGTRSPDLSSVPAGVEAGEMSLEERLLVMLRQEPARSWRIADVAGQLAVSTRSMQRRLNKAGYSFDTLVREARVAEAAKWLRTTHHTLEFIAQTSGFSDQPHFQREFVRVLDVTPAIYREVAQSE